MSEQDNIPTRPDPAYALTLDGVASADERAEMRQYVRQLQSALHAARARADTAERKLAVVSEACATAVLQSGKFQTELVEMQRRYADLKAEHAHLASMCAAAVAEGNVLRRQLVTAPWVALDAVIERRDDISDWNQAREWVDGVVKMKVSEDDKELFAAVESLRQAIGQATYIFMPAGPGMEGKTHTQEGPLSPRSARIGDTIIRPEFPVDPADYE